MPPGPRPGPPAKEYPFKIDPFQQTAVNCLEAGAEGLACPGRRWGGAGEQRRQAGPGSDRSKHAEVLAGGECQPSPVSSRHGWQ